MNDKKLWPIFSSYIRLRDSNENGYCQCITCGAFRYFRQMDCGHGISRGHMGTKYHEKNNSAQCKPCNCYGHGKPAEYKIAMDKKFGPGTWEEILMMSRRPTKFGEFEIQAMMTYFQTEVDRMKREKNLKPEDCLK